MRKASTHSGRRKVVKNPVRVPDREYGNPELPTKEDFRSLVFYRDFHRFISRYWKRHMTSAEYSVLDMIFDRTVGWGKLFEYISLNQFVNGVWNEKSVYSDGTGIPKRTVQRTLNRLLEKGLIVQKKWKTGMTTQYAVNLFWKPPRLQYKDGRKLFQPSGYETFWEKTATEESMAIQSRIEGAGPIIYEVDLPERTEPKRQ